MSESIMAQAEKTHERLTTRVGYTKRERHIMTEAALAAKALVSEGLTIDFDPESDESKQVGIKTIWEHIAYRHVWDCDSGTAIPLPTTRDRIRSLEDNAEVYHRGFRQLERMFREDWKRQLFILPRRPEAGRIEVITLIDAYQINPTQTAAEVLALRVRKHVQGQLRASLEKFEAITGDRTRLGEEVKAILTDLVNQTLPAPRMDPAGYLPDSD